MTTADGRIPLEMPFSTTPSPRYFYLAPQYRTVLNHAISTVLNREGLAIVAGPIGSGKSTMIRFLIDRLGEAFDEGELQLVYLHNPSYKTDFQFLKAICSELGIPPKSRLLEQQELLKSYLFEQDQAKRTVVIIIDEAHKLSGAQLEVVRELFNFASNDRFFAQVILAGEAEPLKHKLKNKQAIQSRAMYYDVLRPLKLDETADLIRYRLRVAELPENLFSASAIAEVHKHSGGIPRAIVKIGRHVFAAYEEDLKLNVNADTILAILDENPTLVAAHG